MNPSENSEHWFDENVAPELLLEFQRELNATPPNSGNNRDRDISSRVMERIRSEQTAIEKVELKRSRRIRERTAGPIRLTAILASVLLLIAGILHFQSGPVSVDVHSRMAPPDDSESIRRFPEQTPHTAATNPPLSDQTADAGMQLVNLGLSGTIRATQNPGEYVCRVFEKLTRSVDSPERKRRTRRQSSIFRSSQDHLVASVAFQLLGRYPE